MKKPCVIACIGDSLTEGDYGTDTPGVGDVHAENYPYFLALQRGCVTHNYGKCGFTARLYVGYYQQGNAPVADADIVVIMLGTNGGMDAHGDCEENRAFEQLIRMVQRDAPQAEIVLCTPPHATENPKKVNYGYEPQVENARVVVRDTAARLGLPLIDVYARSGIGSETEDELQPNDGLHCGKKGYQRLAACIGDGLAEQFPECF